MMILRRLFAVGIVLVIVLVSCVDIVSATDPPHIVINIAARTLSHYAGDRLVKEYPIAVGRPSTPSPRGEYQVIEKVVNPWWYPTTPGMHPVPSGPGNPLGYRWIGFADTYGIHGTNAPWSIGTSASKGCIRMYEEDVEELFPQIAIGTPVSIIYDTVRVTEDQQGNVYIAVYEDIYGYGTGAVSRVRQKLAAIGGEDLINDGEIREIVIDAKGKPENIGKLINVQLNGHLLTAKGMVRKGAVFIPAAAIAQATGASLSTDKNADSMEWQGRTAPVFLCGSGMYVKLGILEELFGARCAYDEMTATAAIELIRVYYNGKPLGISARVIDGILALPLPVLLKATGLKTDSRLGDTITRIAGRQIPAVMHEGIPYLQINRIEDALNIYVYYDTKDQVIQLTYIPFIASGP
jgi:hypothetical protein